MLRLLSGHAGPSSNIDLMNELRQSVIQRRQATYTYIGVDLEAKTFTSSVCRMCWIMDIFVSFTLLFHSKKYTRSVASCFFSPYGTCVLTNEDLSRSNSPHLQYMCMQADKFRPSTYIIYKI